MTRSAGRASTPSGTRRRGSALASALATTAVGCALLVPGATAAPQAPTSQSLVVLRHAHVARRAPSADAARIEAVPARRPLTRGRTVLPVLASATPRDRGEWLRVWLPGRPNGHTGWISRTHTRLTVTGWRIRVELSSRRVTVYHDGHVRRRFPAIVGKPSTPTPRGSFFVEEALALPRYAAGGPFALATSARSNVFHEFEGGPGQIGIHGTNGLSGTLGTAASHGCIRLGTGAITWLAHRMGAGVPLDITG